MFVNWNEIDDNSGVYAYDEKNNKYHFSYMVHQWYLEEMEQVIEGIKKPSYVSEITLSNMMEYLEN